MLGFLFYVYRCLFKLSASKLYDLFGGLDFFNRAIDHAWVDLVVLSNEFIA